MNRSRSLVSTNIAKHYYLDVIQQRVTPVQSVGLIVHGEAVGPPERRVPEHLHVGAVHVGPGDTGEYFALK